MLCPYGVASQRARPKAPAWPRISSDPWQPALALSYALLAFLIVYPLAQLFVSSLRAEGGAWTLAHFRDFFALRYYRAALDHSIYVGVMVTVCATAIGVPLAAAVTRWRVPGPAVLRALIVLPLVSPPFIGAYSWILLLGRNGWVTRLLERAYLAVRPSAAATIAGDGIPWIGSIYGAHGIILALTLNLYPFVFLVVAAALRSIDVSLEEAAANLGATPWRTFRTVTMRLLTPAILGGALLVFLTAVADFGSAVIIGEDYMVLPTLIYSLFINEMGGEPAMAAAASVVLLALTTAVLLVERWYVGRRSYVMSGLRRRGEREISPGLRALATAFTYGIVGLSLIPSLVVMVTSFFPSRGPMMQPGFSLGNYDSVFRSVPRAMFNSLFLSGVSTLACVVLGVIIGYLLVRRKGRATAGLDTLLMVPYAIPGTVLAVALISAFGAPPLLLTGTVAILIASYTVRRLPYAVRGVTTVLHNIEPATEEASLSLGASPARTFGRVTLPLMMPGIISGAVMTWIQVISEISSTILLYYGAWATMSVVIYQQVLSDNFGTAAAASTLLLAGVLVPLLAFNVWQGERAAELV
jgi:iron(III) transport system permease protein